MIRWLCGPNCRIVGIAWRDIDRCCLVAENYPKPSIGCIHPPLHIAVSVARGDILQIVQGVA